jgi:AAA15 family ATPase/GTPase
MLPDVRKKIRPDVITALGLDKNPKWKPCRILVVTGQNASGKSFFRRMWRVGFDKKKIDKKSVSVLSISQESRSSSFLGHCFMYGDESWEATGLITYNSVSGSLYNIIENKSWKGTYILVLDEPEIGMSQELQLTTARHILKKVDSWSDKLVGIVVTTHSPVFVKELMTHEDAQFFNIGYEYKTADEWLNREIKELDLENLQKTALEKFREIRKLIKS